jgi:hypothetical protein
VVDIPCKRYAGDKPCFAVGGYTQSKIRKGPYGKPHFQPAAEWSIERKSKIDALSLLAFAERLGKSDVGKAMSEASALAAANALGRACSRGQLSRYGVFSW